jgi:hypothetical protein
MIFATLATLVMQAIIFCIVAANMLFAYRVKRNAADTLEAIYKYRREIAWMEARLDALEKKGGEKTWQVIDGRREQ